MIGKFKWFDREKGYGFISGDDGNDYFVHASKIKPGEYNDDDTLMFEIAESRKGLKAIDVRLA